MKSKFCILIVFATFTIIQKNVAQISLENRFDFEKIIRLKLEYDGEKYATFLPDSQKIKLYSIDHSVWREFAFSIDPTSEYVIYDISQGMLNNDSLLEITYGFRYSTSTPYETKIMNETGSNILTINDVSYPPIAFYENLFEPLSYKTIGNQVKLLVNTESSNNPGFSVYSVPQLQLEHTYQNLNLIEIENEGSKYIEIIDNDFSNDYTLKLYNLDHSSYKNILIDLDSYVPSQFLGSYYIFEIIDISKFKVNSDNEIEVLLNVSFDNGLFINENFVIGVNENAVLLNSPLSTGSGGKGSLMKDSSNYYLIYFNTNLLSFPGAIDTSFTNIHALPGFQLLYNYPYTKVPVVFDSIGTKLYEANKLTGEIKFYNINNTLWKTINLPIPAFPNASMQLFIIDNVYFDNDSLIEILYRTQYAITGNLFASGNIFKEGVGNVLTIDSCMFFYIDSKPNLFNKIIVNKLKTGGSMPYFGTEIYTWPGGVNRLMGINNNKFEIKNYRTFELMPNPSGENLNITFKSIENKNKIEIIDLQGKVLYTQTILSKNESVNVSWLSKGTYLIRVENETGKFVKL